jgi:dipeptidyl aminopeptidase/acylaminoacyl peptidase
MMMLRVRRPGLAAAPALAMIALVRLSLTVAAAAPATATGSSPAAPGGPQWTPAAIVDTVQVDDVALSPDGGTILYTRSRWRGPEDKPGPAFTNIWAVPFEGGPERRLTTFDAADDEPRISPDGAWISFLSARRPDSARKQIWLMGARGGEAGALTDPKLSVELHEWSPDGKRIAFVAADPKSEQKEKDEKAGRDQVVVDRDLPPRRIYVLDVTTGASEPLAALGDRSAWGLAWAPDGSALVATVTAVNRTDESYLAKRLLILPLRGEARELVPVVGKVGPLAWSADGRSIAWLGGVEGADPTAGSVLVIPAAGGTPKNLSGDRPETARAIAWNGDGTIAVASAVGTGSTLAAVDPSTGAWRTVLPPGSVAFTSASWSRDGARYAIAGSTGARPTEVFGGIAAGREPAGRPRRLTRTNPQLDGLPRGAQEVLRYPARDGLPIEAILIRPVGSAAPGRAPLVVIVHGGPEYEDLDEWHNGYTEPGQALAERGFAVLFPNYRGSAGRGVGFAKADQRDLGGREFTDILDGVDHLVARGLVDPKRVGIMGGSYGGYMTALAVTRDSDRFAAGVELFGITDWESFLGQSDIPGENSRVHWALWCYEEAALCRDRSPIAHVQRARTPTLILQGEKDLRVPKPQSDQLYAALRYRNVPVEYVVYPREEHGFKEREHRLDALTRTLDWFERHLKHGAR